MTYFPPPHPEWQHRNPDEAGLDASGIAAAARHAAAHETPWSRDLARMVASDFGEAPPWNETLGPVRPRGAPNGLVLRGGRIVAEWGDTAQVDLTFSVAKSYLSILAGLAWDRGLIRDPDEEVCRTPNVDWDDDGGFAPPHNDKITWHHLLQQTSEWEGELWGKPDLIDRHRSVGGRPATGQKGTHRDLRAPGEFWEYNDVRVNRLALALLRAMAAAAAGSVSRAGDGPDRRLLDMGMARLPQLLRRNRRQAHAVGVGRLALGRRRVHPRAGSGADRSHAVARRRLERPAHPVRGMDFTDARAVPALSAIRLFVVA